MREIRPAVKGEVTQQKEIWKLCFGDSDEYVDFFYSYLYKEEDTMLLLENGKICGMLTLLPIKIHNGQEILNSVMLYAIATHPQYQNRGFATGLMDYTYQYIREKNIFCAVLVPANQQLFDFYYQKGYQDGFYITESVLTKRRIENLTTDVTYPYFIAPIISEEYNRRRNEFLKGSFYVSYTDEEITYQKKLSQLSGTDIYGIDVGEIQGCAAIERVNEGQVLIKEILIPDKYLTLAVKKIAETIYAEMYIIRTTVCLGQQLGGVIRPFAMIKGNHQTNQKEAPEKLGYLGLAFD